MKEKPAYDGHNRRPVNHVKLARHRRVRRTNNAKYWQFVRGQQSGEGYYRL